MRGARVEDEETVDCIRSVHERTGYLLDPHTAVAFRAMERHHDGAAGPAVVIATAHPAKFPDAVEAATGQRPPLPDHMADLFDREERVTRVPNDLEALKDIIKGGIAQ